MTTTAKKSKPRVSLYDQIKAAGWFLNECEDGTFQVKDWHGDPDETGPFNSVRQARDWAKANPITETAAKS